MSQPQVPNSPSPSDPAVIADLSRRFEWFADRVCAGYCPLYEALCRGIANDPALLSLAACARPGQPVPNVFLSAVKFLLLDGVEPGHRLHAIMAGATESAEDVPSDAFDVWREFVLAHADAVRLQVAWRNVQTNDVNRCTVLLPAYSIIAERSGKPLALVEAGTSAGLNLLWPQYRHEYRNAQMTASLGPDDSPVELLCELRGPHVPPHLASSENQPELASAVGVDLVPVDVTDPDQRRWLQALVWPGHKLREQRLVAALQLAAAAPPRLVEGNVLTWLTRLDELVESDPSDAALVVSHSFVLNQLTDLERDTFGQRLQAATATRNAVYCVGFEHVADMVAELWLTTYRDGAEPQREHLANAQPHGQWMEWLAT